jgi:diguanylate cyclase (GGDEF)-like protein
MTLYRQLLVFTTILFAILFATVWIEKLHSTRVFFADQLELTAQDTATSLGLSLSPFMAGEDLPTVETMVNAIFDRGYYRVISLRDIHGEVLYERNLEVTLVEVPHWFINLVSLETPGASSLVMAGWSQAGSLYIESHPGYAYKTLWHTALRISLYFLLTCVAVLLIGGLGIRMLLRPLEKLKGQAEAICRREYEIQENVPVTRELRQVVETMNRMTNKVREMFEEQAEIADRMRRNAYYDIVTGLGNRRYLQGRVEAGLATPAEAGGAFLLVHVFDLQLINDQKSFTAGDELLAKVASILKISVKAVDNAALARISGADFAVFLPQVSRFDAEQVAEEIVSMLSLLAVEQLTLSTNVAAVGGVAYRKAASFAGLLAEADTALAAARNKGKNAWRINDSSIWEGEKGKNWWRETISAVLDHKEIILVYQPVVAQDENRRLLHVEVFSRILLPSGELINAGVFIPLAERLASISRLDSVVLEKVFTEACRRRWLKKVAVNISPTSLEDSVFRAWLMNMLTSLGSQSLQLVFEFVEFAAVQHLETVRDFAESVKKLGHSVGLDHFGQSFANFGYLKSLKPEYVKLDRVYTTELNGDRSDNAFFVGALCSAAHSLDIQVIADGVELDSQLALLQALHVDGVQGYLIGPPERLVD